jgi:hypothetical protein
MKARCNGLILEYAGEIEALATRTQNGLCGGEDIKGDVDALLREALRFIKLLTSSNFAANWAALRARIEMISDTADPNHSEYRKVIQLAISGLDQLTSPASAS